MEPSLSASLVAASAQSKIATAVAARMIQIDQDSTQKPIGTIQENAETLETIVSNLAEGTGNLVDLSA